MFKISSHNGIIAATRVDEFQASKECSAVACRPAGMQVDWMDVILPTARDGPGPLGSPNRRPEPSP